MKKILPLLIIVVVITILIGCNSSSSSIVGRWSGDKISVGLGSITELEFFSDGTYTSNHSNYTGSYSISGNRLKLAGLLVSDLTYNFKVHGNTLTFYSDNGDVLYKFKKS